MMYSFLSYGQVGQFVRYHKNKKVHFLRKNNEDKANVRKALTADSKSALRSARALRSISSGLGRLSRLPRYGFTIASPQLVKLVRNSVRQDLDGRHNGYLVIGCSRYHPGVIVGFLYGHPVTEHIAAKLINEFFFCHD
jgi:hypothetical protein